MNIYIHMNYYGQLLISLIDFTWLLAVTSLLGIIIIYVLINCIGPTLTILFNYIILHLFYIL